MFNNEIQISMSKEQIKIVIYKILGIMVIFILQFVNGLERACVISVVGWKLAKKIRNLLQSLHV